MNEMNQIAFPPEIVNHIFSYCESRTNQIMKEHIETVDEYKDRYSYCKELHLIHILDLMAFYGHIYFDKKKFHSRFYRCMNCSRIGYAEPLIEFGEKFCSFACADQFDY